MSKPQKPKTSGLSAGPTAYWDSISDAKKDAKIEQLREENERLRSEVKHKEGLVGLAFDSLDRKNSIADTLLKENKRLREENKCFEAMKAGVEIRIADLNADNNRLRELLKALYDRGGISNELWHRIKSEVGDE